MRNIEKIVLEVYRELLESNNLEITSDLNNKVGREYGLDSLGIVDFIVNIEDKLNENLDPILANIRQCNTVNDIVNEIKQLLQKSTN